MNGGHIVEEYELEKYLQLEKTIKTLEDLLKYTRKETFQQNLTTHVSCSEERGLYVEAPRVEKIVLENITACELIEKRIERYKVRLKYFRMYLYRLSLKERQSLYNGSWSDGLKERTLDEIREIETAVCLREQIEPPDEKVVLSDGDLFDTIEAMANVFL